jgi:hypothetical protein
MKVTELVAKLQEMPADADVYLGWIEVNESGTAWDTGKEASYVECEFGGKNKPDHVVIK